MNEIALIRRAASWEAGHPPLHMTADEFLLWEGDGSGRKFHLIDGEVWALSLASVAHGVIQANLCHLLLNAIESSSAALAVVSKGTVVPALHAKDNVRVADVLVAAEGSGQSDVLVNDPIALIEIQAPGNRSLTRDNVRAYATLPSVREILVVHTSRVELEVLRRNDGGAWPANPETVEPGGRLRLETAGLECPVERVYARTWLIRSGA